MSARLKAGVWVAAYMRVVRLQGGFAYLTRRGAEEAGSVLLRFEQAGGVVVLSPTHGVDGVRVWMRATGAAPVSAADAEAYVARRLQTDPDLWVIDVESREGRHFLSEPVEGEDTV